MSDRRTVALVIAILTIVVGVAVIAVATVSLQDSFMVSGEIGIRTEISGELIATTTLGALFVIGGIGTATGLVLAQSRGAQR